MQDPCYGCCTATPIADATNLSFHGQLIRYVVTVVFLSTIWFATKDNKRGFKKKKHFVSQKPKKTFLKKKKKKKKKKKAGNGAPSSTNESG
jgi:hypothetical protein